MANEYIQFNKAVAEGTLEAEQLDAREAQRRVREDRIARGYCPVHSSVKVSNGAFDAPCGLCEMESDEAYEAGVAQLFANEVYAPVESFTGAAPDRTDDGGAAEYDRSSEVF